MMPIGFHSLVSAWLVLLVPVLVLFYFLKLRRPRTQVPSLVLWRRVLADRRVNSPFQRFRRNLLLWLQLLLLLLLILAALQPYLRRRAAGRRRLPILIDCSASMAALDRPGGETRLDAAKRLVAERIDNLLPDQEICLLSFAGAPRRETGFTNNRRLLREALAGLRVEDVPGNLGEAMQVLRALGRQNAFRQVLLVSDGNLPRAVDEELSFDIAYRLTAPAGPNAGITAFNARAGNTGGGWDVFLALSASGDRPLAGTVELLDGREAIGRESVLLTPGMPERILFRRENPAPALLTARFLPDDFDSLAADNIAFLPLPEHRPLAVRVTPALPAYRHALRACGNVTLVDDPAAPCDLAVIDADGPLPDQVPCLLAAGRLPGELRAVLEPATGPFEVVDWLRDCDLLRHVQFRDVLISAAPVLKPGMRPDDVEARGFDILAESSRGPLILRREYPTRVQYFLLFHPDRSTLPFRVAFPVMAANLAAKARALTGLHEVRAPRTGVLPVLRGAPGETCMVVGPDGRRIQRVFGPDGTLEGLPAPRAGVYKVRVGSARVPMGAALLDEHETRLERVEKLHFRENLGVTAEREAPTVERPLWRLLALIAFVVLLAEWWWYQRRG